MSRNKITIKDVAQHAGVGMGTVSRVLNGSGPVSEETKQRVLDAMEKLKFQPHIIARGLRTSKLPTVGMIVSDITNPLFAEIVQATQIVLIQNGFELVLGITNGNPMEEERALKSFESQGVSGIILSLTDDSNEQIREIIKEMTIPIILLDRQLPDCEMDAVMHEHSKGSEEAVDYLVGLGHRNIGLLFGSANTIANRSRKESILARLKTHDIPLPLKSMYQTKNTKDGYKAMIHLLEKDLPPTAIIIGNNQLFVEALKALRDKKVQYPHDLSIISYDDTILTRFIEKPITVVKRDLEEFGREAAQLIISKIANQSKGVTKRILSTWLEIRESCKSIL